MGRFARLLKAAVVVPVPELHAAPVLLPSNRGRPAEAGPPFHGRIELPGMTVDVENAKGSYREGVGPDGKPWRTYMRAHYGEIRGSEGRDGDAVDAYVGPDAHSPLAVVVHQVDPDTGAPDEDKVMLGWRDEGRAVAAYKRQYDRPGFYGGHTAMGLPKLAALVADPERRGKMLGGAPAESRRMGREEWKRHTAQDVEKMGPRKLAKGPDVESLLSAIMHRGGHDKATAIRIAKARGLIHQAGEHLAMGKAPASKAPAPKGAPKEST